MPRRSGRVQKTKTKRSAKQSIRPTKDESKDEAETNTLALHELPITDQLMDDFQRLMFLQYEEKTKGKVHMNEKTVCADEITSQLQSANIDCELFSDYLVDNFSYAVGSMVEISKSTVDISLMSNEKPKIASNYAFQLAGRLLVSELSSMNGTAVDPLEKRAKLLQTRLEEHGYSLPELLRLVANVATKAANCLLNKNSSTTPLGAPGPFDSNFMTAKPEDLFVPTSDEQPLDEWDPMMPSNILDNPNSQENGEDQQEEVQASAFFDPSVAVLAPDNLEITNHSNTPPSGSSGIANEHFLNLTPFKKSKDSSKTIVCESCNTEVPSKSSTRKYCTKCAAKRNKFPYRTSEVDGPICAHCENNAQVTHEDRCRSCYSKFMARRNRDFHQNESENFLKDCLSTSFSRTPQDGAESLHLLPLLHQSIEGRPIRNRRSAAVAAEKAIKMCHAGGLVLPNEVGHQNSWMNECELKSTLRSRFDDPISSHSSSFDHEMSDPFLGSDQDHDEDDRMEMSSDSSDIEVIYEKFVSRPFSS